MRPGAVGRGGAGAAAARLPAPVHVQLAQAAAGGFHDAIWLLVVLSFLGLCAAALLRDRREDGNRDMSARTSLAGRLSTPLDCRAAGHDLAALHNKPETVRAQKQADIPQWVTV